MVSGHAVHVAPPPPPPTPAGYEGEEHRHRGRACAPPVPQGWEGTGLSRCRGRRPRAPQAPAARLGGHLLNQSVRGGAGDVHPEPDWSSRGWTPSAPSRGPCRSRLPATPTHPRPQIKPLPSVVLVTSVAVTLPLT